MEGDVYMFNQSLESVSAKAHSASGQEAVTRPAASTSMSAKRLAPVEKQCSLHHRTNSFSGGYGALVFPFDVGLAAWSVRSEMPFRVPQEAWYDVVRWCCWGGQHRRSDPLNTQVSVELSTASHDGIRFRLQHAQQFRSGDEEDEQCHERHSVEARFWHYW